MVGVVRDGRLLLDCRTLTDAEADEVAAAVTAARARTLVAQSHKVGFCLGAA